MSYFNDSRCYKINEKMINHKHHISVKTMFLRRGGPFQMKSGTAPVLQLQWILRRHRDFSNCWDEMQVLGIFLENHNGQFCKSGHTHPHPLNLSNLLHLKPIWTAHSMGLLSKGLSRDRVGILLWQGVFLCSCKDSSLHCIYRKRKINLMSTSSSYPSFCTHR